MSDLTYDAPGSTLLSRIRRNHGLEHATIHLLSRKFPKKTLVGRSDSKGFFLFGDIPTETLRETLSEALERLRNGEHELAVHPNCGTNIVTAAMLAGGASFLSLMGSKEEDWRQRLERLPLAIAATVLALLVARPAGRAAQQHITTIADPGNLEIAGIRMFTRGPATVHRVITKS
jgi:hypothetical protein